MPDMNRRWVLPFVVLSTLGLGVGGALATSPPPTHSLIDLGTLGGIISLGGKTAPAAACTGTDRTLAPLTGLVRAAPPVLGVNAAVLLLGGGPDGYTKANSFVFEVTGPSGRVELQAKGVAARATFRPTAPGTYHVSARFLVLTCSNPALGITEYEQGTAGPVSFQVVERDGLPKVYFKGRAESEPVPGFAGPVPRLGLTADMLCPDPDRAVDQPTRVVVRWAVRADGKRPAGPLTPTSPSTAMTFRCSTDRDAPPPKSPAPRLLTAPWGVLAFGGFNRASVGFTTGRDVRLAIDWYSGATPIYSIRVHARPNQRGERMIIEPGTCPAHCSRSWIPSRATFPWSDLIKPTGSVR